jgi:hypothetical protein
VRKDNKDFAFLYLRITQGRQKIENQYFIEGLVMKRKQYIV